MVINWRSMPERTNPTEIGPSELFDIQTESDISGIFMIEAKRLKRRE